MGFTTVKTVCSMREWFPICGRWSRQHIIRLTLVASCKGMIIIFAVKAHTDWAHHVEKAAVVKVVDPATAMGTVRHANMGRCLTEEANNLPNIE